MELTLANGLVVQLTPQQNFTLTGTGIDDVLTGMRMDDVSPGETEPAWEDPTTLGIGNQPSAVTLGVITSRSPLASAIEAIQRGRLAVPTDIRDMLTQAVAARESRLTEDVEAWAERLADEAVRADS
jgi:hypothetical protein